MWRKLKYTFLAIFFLVLLIACFINKSVIAPQTIRDIAMDTYFEITTFQKAAREVSEEILSDVKYLESIFNRYDEKSVLYEVNKKAFREPVSYPPVFEEVLLKSIELSDYTEGHFNPTIGPLVDIWREIITGDNINQLPDDKLIEEAKSVINTEYIIFNQKYRQVSFSKPEVSLDLGAVMKGFAVDRAFAILRRRGVEQAVINAGGTIGVFGSPPGKKYWQIGIQHPRKEGIIGVLNLASTMVVSTSGDYERFKIIAGKRYHHLLNPFTGYPPDELASVTVINKNGFLSDAVSTAVISMGLSKGLDFLEQKSLTAVIITSDLQIYFTGGADKLFQPEP